MTASLTWIRPSMRSEPTQMQAAAFEYYSAPIANGRIAALNSTRLKQCW